MSANDARKQSLYFPEDMLNEIQQQAQRLDRSLELGRATGLEDLQVRAAQDPSPNDMLDDDPAAQRG